MSRFDKIDLYDLRSDLSEEEAALTRERPADRVFSGPENFLTTIFLNSQNLFRHLFQFVY